VERKLRYSERKTLAEAGTLGDYQYDEVPVAFRNALWYLIYHPESNARTNMVTSLQAEARLHFGWPGDVTPGSFVEHAPVDQLLDFIEILIERCTSHRYAGPYDATLRRNRHVTVMADIEDRVNTLCERHRFGYRFAGGEARKLSSPALEATIVGPTLLAAQRPGWEQVERSYREALHHQRGGETDDAVTAAHAALEAALKAVGMSGQFSTMAKQFRNSSFVPPYLRGTPQALDALLDLLAKSNAVRSTEGDAHGKAPGATDVPPELADLAVHWAGAFIVYLAEATR
jgi:hypothetical protein